MDGAEPQSATVSCSRDESGTPKSGYTIFGRGFTIRRSVALFSPTHLVSAAAMSISSATAAAIRSMAGTRLGCKIKTIRESQSRLCKTSKTFSPAKRQPSGLSFLARSYRRMMPAQIMYSEISARSIVLARRPERVLTTIQRLARVAQTILELPLLLQLRIGLIGRRPTTRHAQAPHHGSSWVAVLLRSG